MLHTGKVRFFNVQRGFGFIQPDKNSDKEVFVHFSALQMDGFKKLKRNQRVRFAIEQNEKGEHATKVEVIANDSE